jgi:hypothetical protein
MEDVPDHEMTGGGMQPGTSATTLPDYEDEPEPGMDGDSPDEQGNELSYVEEYGMEVEPAATGGELPKERSYSVKSNQSDSSVSEKAKKFIAENRIGLNRKQNIESGDDGITVPEKNLAANPPPPPAQWKTGSGTTNDNRGGGEKSTTPGGEGPTGLSPSVLYDQGSQEQIGKCCELEHRLWGGEGGLLPRAEGRGF